MGLNGKRVLIFCPDFFGYREQIVQQLQQNQCHVDLYDERPSTDSVTKVLLRLNCPLIRPKVHRYFERIIENHRDERYDYVFVIKGEAVDSKVVSMLRRAYPNAVFVLYLWDSVANIPDCEKKIGLYDRVLTFDPDDSQKYGLPFRPLFYGSGFESAAENAEFEYDVCFIGTAHSIRPRIVAQIAQSCQRAGLRFYSYLYLPHVLVYYHNKLVLSDYKYLDRSQIHFTPLSREQMQRIYRSSRCILDVEHPKQQGITTRPLEMLKMQKKVITTNRQIVDYDFYNSANFSIIDTANPEVDTDFLQQDFVPASQQLLDKYSVQGFLDAVLY